MVAKGGRADSQGVLIIGPRQIPAGNSSAQAYATS
jgi:hypothetical protein